FSTSILKDHFGGRYAARVGYGGMIPDGLQPKSFLDAGSAARFLRSIEAPASGWSRLLSQTDSYSRGARDPLNQLAQSVARGKVRFYSLPTLPADGAALPELKTKHGKSFVLRHSSCILTANV